MGKEKFERMRLFIIVGALQVLFLVLFAVFADYDDKAKSANSASGGGAEVAHYYAMFQDVHVMMFIGFGFLMTFLKRYGFGSVGLNLLVAAFVLQWATLMYGFFHMIPVNGVSYSSIPINMETLLTSDFCAAAILISMGALLGKISPLQLIVMAFFEVVFFQLNEWVGFKHLLAADVGGSIFVHIFGAYFGIACGRMLHDSKGLDKAHSKESSVYHSDLFAMIGTIFLWLFWPSFNSVVAADGDDQYRAIIHTYFSLAAGTVTSFIVSTLVEKGKFDMVHVQNATLAGGVAVGAVADLNIQPWGAILIGMVSGALSVLGYRYVTPFMAKRLALHDTCGVNNLHGMPGIMAAVASIVVAAMAKPEDYGSSFTAIYPGREEPGGRSAGAQAGYQAAALFMTLGISVVGGILTGLLLRLPIFGRPKPHQIYDDTDYWIMPEEGFPSSGVHRGYNPTEGEGDSNSTDNMAVNNGKESEITKV